MNIKEAKQQIKDALKVYFSKDEFGGYIIPIERQRPVMLIGAPGIGKTAIMEQIAQELGVGILSYSMTHHTRQSALGLPFISEKEYGGKMYNVTEYTMSEIISSVYEMIEDSGIKEGILFLDEINCVSETLSPIILQFLQYKVFGKHQVPNGWIIVTAGNPPEYNDSARDYDVVTWDRLKRIDVEPDYNVWREYAINKGVHPAILTYLDLNKSRFYIIETTPDGKRFVTARGWDDLSTVITLYEKNNIEVTNSLIVQYLQQPRIAREFSAYYDLFSKYKSDYKIPEILKGIHDKKIIDRAKKAKFDERLAIISLLLSNINDNLKDFFEREKSVIDIFNFLTGLGKSLETSATLESKIKRHVTKIENDINKKKIASNLSVEDQRIHQTVVNFLTKLLVLVKNETNNVSAYEIVKKEYSSLHKSLLQSSKIHSKELHNVFVFLEKAFGDGQEILIFVTELTMSQYSANFIAKFGCEKYYQYNKDLLFNAREKEIIMKIENLKID